MDPVTTALLIGSIASGLAGAGASIINTRNTNKLNARSVASTNQANQQIQQSVNQTSINEAQKNRNYYSPQNLMKQYVAAGLNPNLVSGNIASSASAGASTPQLGASVNEAAQSMPLPFSSAGQQLGNSLQQVAEINKTNSESDVNKSQVVVNDHVIANLDSQIMKNKQDIQESLARIREIATKIDNLQATIRNLNEDTFLKRVQAVTLSNESNARIQQIYAQIERWAHQNNLDDAVKAKTDEEKAFLVASFGLRLSGLDLQNQKTAAEIFNISTDSVLKKYQAAGQLLQNKGIVWDNKSKQLQFNTSKMRFFEDKYRSDYRYMMRTGNWFLKTINGIFDCLNFAVESGAGPLRGLLSK